MQAHNINDIRFLRKAIVWMGWQNLMVTPSEVDSSLDFWKRCWETGLIESEYLEKKFRKR
jgi:predicted nicotinamide N-methyase